MGTGGELAVHDNVTFEANAAAYGGAVSLRFSSIARPSGVFYVLKGFARVGSIR